MQSTRRGSFSVHRSENISQKLGNGKFFLIGDAIEGQYVANNLHFAAAIAFILMVILLIAMALMKRYTDGRVQGGV